MFDSDKKDKQAEFFNDYSCVSKKPRSQKFNFGKTVLTLSYENIVVSSIGFLMVLIICYSLGVERGKHLVIVSTKTIEITSEATQIKEEQEKTKPVKTNPKPTIKRPRIEIALKPMYTIQVATFRKNSSVKKERQRLEVKGYKPFVLTKGKFYEICIGNYQKLNDAVASKEMVNLKKMYGDCFVRKH